MTLRSSALLAGGNGTSAAVPVPAGATSGDIAVVGVYKESTSVFNSIASGFTQKVYLSTSASARGSLAVFWKRLTAADTGTYSFGWSGSTFKGGASCLFSGRATTGDPFDTTGTAESTTSVNQLAVACSPSVSGCDLVDFTTDFTGGNSWNTPPTGFTTQVNNDIIGAFTLDNAASGATGNLTPIANVSGFMKAFLGALLPAAGGGASLTLGLVSEADSAFALGRSKSRIFGMPQTSDFAQALDRIKAATLGQPVEMDTASPLTPSKALGLGQPTEADTAPPLSGAKSRALGLTQETDTTLQTSATKSRELGLPVESDQALTVSPVKVKTLGLPQEIDTAFGLVLGGGVSLVLGLITDTESALPLGFGKIKTLGLVASADVALGLAPAKDMMFGAPVEADAVFPLEFSKTLELGLTYEVDEALGLDIVMDTGPVVKIWHKGQLIDVPLAKLRVYRHGIGIPVDQIGVANAQG